MIRAAWAPSVYWNFWKQMQGFFKDRFCCLWSVATCEMLAAAARAVVAGWPSREACDFAAVVWRGFLPCFYLHIFVCAIACLDVCQPCCLFRVGRVCGLAFHTNKKLGLLQMSTTANIIGCYNNTIRFVAVIANININLFTKFRGYWHKQVYLVFTDANTGGHTWNRRMNSLSQIAFD